MKDQIIQETIKSLQTEGLRFSVDTLAERLKISKKTVYKYFSNKESLALAMYEKYYGAVNEKMTVLLRRQERTVLSDLLYLYYDAKNMSRREIFNKYKLNNTIRSYTAEQNDLLWTTVASGFYGVLSTAEIYIVRIIVDGTFEKLCENHGTIDGVIERLVRLI